MAFAKVEWSVGDVLSLTEDPDSYEPTITEEQAEAFLERNERFIQDRLISLGWDTITDLLRMDGLT
jgi:hypothetical protein